MALLPASIVPQKHSSEYLLGTKFPSQHTLGQSQDYWINEANGHLPSLLMATAAENKFGRNSVSPTMEEANGTAESSQSVTWQSIRGFVCSEALRTSSPRRCSANQNQWFMRIIRKSTAVHRKQLLLLPQSPICPKPMLPSVRAMDIRKVFASQKVATGPQDQKATAGGFGPWERALSQQDRRSHCRSQRGKRFLDAERINGKYFMIHLGRGITICRMLVILDF